jgi:membrane fusion protein, multidrug efflux system
MKRYPVIAYPLLSLLGLLIIPGCGKPPIPPPAAAPQVEVLTIVAEELPLNRTLVGRTVANHTVDVVARVTGTVLERPYHEGELVAADDVLFRIDPQEFLATLESARAKVAQVQAQVSKAETDLKRIEPLAKAGAAPMADLDGSRTALLIAQADLRAATAQVTRAELDLSYTTITAPLTGLAGKSAVDVGALVSPTGGPLCVLDQVDPIAVEFTMSEREMLTFQADIASQRIRVIDREQVTVTASLVDGEIYPETGKLSFRSVRIKPETGTALLRALFPNPKGKLRAGQFVRVTLSGAMRLNAILVPQAAVIQSPTGSSVYVVKPDQTVDVRTVTLGTWEGPRWLISDGLIAGDVVITEGILKVRPGAKVLIKAPTTQGAAVPSTTKP